MWGPGSECRRRLRRLQGAHGVEAVSPPDLHGDWVSSSCETRSGPRFLTRRYKFHSDLAFTFYQFYYSDHQCQTPAYSFRVRGRLTLAGLTLLVDGATEALYDIEKVTLTVFQEEFAARMSRQMNGTCPDLVQANQPLDLFRKYAVVDNTRPDVHIDCTHGLAFSMNELLLLRQEVYERRVEPTGQIRRTEKLYLGDTNTDVALTTSHMPKGYQTPLRRYDEDSRKHCSVCQIVYNAREHKPPVLPRQQLDNIELSGAWVSVHCEVRSVYFLTRHLIFFENQTWEGHFHYYRDPLCVQPRYTVSVKGTRTAGVPSAIVEGATNFKFTSLAMYLTPQSDEEVQRFNAKGAGCGRRRAWRLGRTLDVTSTGGCDVIGVSLPHTEFEIMKKERDPEVGTLLFNGQRPSSGQIPSTEALRSTSFQSPLVQCSEGNPFDLHSEDNVAQTNPGNSAHSERSSNTRTITIAMVLILTLVIRCRYL